MPRPKKVVSIDEEIKIEEDAVAKARARYDAHVARLKDLHAKRDEERKKVLWAAIEASERTYDEILAFVQSKTSEQPVDELEEG